MHVVSVLHRNRHHKTCIKSGDHSLAISVISAPLAVTIFALIRSMATQARPNPQVSSFSKTSVAPN